jgi:hypothetical protein
MSAELAILLHGKSGAVAMVDDDETGRWAATRKWYLSRTGYVTLARAVNGQTYLHRIVMNASHDGHVDHINGNKLDNRKCNLRICTQAENNRNLTSKRSDSKQPYKGVRITASGKWNARIRSRGHGIHIGNFDTAEAAALAYDEKAKQLFGTFAATNFGA